MKLTSVVSLLLALAILISSGIVAVPSAIAQGPGFTEVFTWTNAAGQNSQPRGLVFGIGGPFAGDLFVTDELVGRGSCCRNKVWRLVDLNGDGDMKDAGESFLTLAPSSPSNTDLGLGLTVAPDSNSAFGSDLYTADDGTNRVWRISQGAADLTFTTFASGNFVTPNDVHFLPDSSTLLVLDVWNFTLFGGGTDGRIQKVDANGNIGTWLNSSNASGIALWDPGQPATMLPDGTLIFVNGNVGSNGPREMLAARDHNGDGDAQDAGEVWRLTGHIGLTPAMTNRDGVIYFSNQGRTVHTLIDENGDGDFWDFASNQFDAGELGVLIEDLPGSTQSMNFGPDGALYVGLRGSVAEPNNLVVGSVIRVGDPVAVNNPPVANDDQVVTDEDTAVTFDVLANDTDADGDPLVVNGNTAPANGSVVDNGGGAFTYTPDPDFNGADAFTYDIGDGNGGTDMGSVNVTVNPVNDAPVAVDDEAVTDAGTPVTIDVLANDVDVDGDVLQVVDVTQGASGSVGINPDGTVTYTPFGINDLMARVQGLTGLNRGQRNALLAKLRAANRSLQRGNLNAASGQLGAFVNQVEAFARTGKLDPATAAELIVAAGALLAPPDSADAFTYTVSDGELLDTATANVIINQ